MCCAHTQRKVTPILVAASANLGSGDRAAGIEIIEDLLKARPKNIDVRFSQVSSTVGLAVQPCE